MPPRVDVRWLAEGSLSSGGLAEIAKARAGGGPVWVDVTEADQATLAVLGAAFPLHPLALEDCLHTPQRPKLDSYDSGPFVVWVVPDAAPDGRFAVEQFEVFLGKDYVITVHQRGVDVIADVEKDAEALLGRGPEWLLHAILDRAVDHVFPLLDLASDQLGALEDELIRAQTAEGLKRLHLAKRRLMALQRIVGPERDAIRAMARQQEFVSQDAYLYLQDVGDHLARIEDYVGTFRDVASGVMDIYLSAQSNRLSEVMRRLTVVATIFMPGTFIVGMYGMNFRFMPELGWRFGYAFALALIVGVTVGMLAWFRRSDWW